MDAIKEFLFQWADDCLIYGHRNSEWTGLGPTLEEDISFSSMAQDKVGQSWNIYKILNQEFGEKDADQLGFNREEKEYKCCHLTEIFSRDYAFCLTRHFFFDHAEAVKINNLISSSHVSVAQLARKLKGEVKYHILHANTWMRKLAEGTEESKARMQSAINETFGLALGIFEDVGIDQELIDNKVYYGNNAAKEEWLSNVTTLLTDWGYKVPENDAPNTGGRKGMHTEDLQPLLTEMTEVFSLDPTVVW